MNNTAQTKTPMLALLSMAARLTWNEREPLALLAGLYALLALALIWPVRDLYQYVWSAEITIGGGLPPELWGAVKGLVVVWFASQLLWCIIWVIWARLISLGRGQVFWGGLGPFVGRVFGAYVRLLLFIGLYIGITLVVAAILSVILAVAGLSEQAAAGIAIPVLSAVAFFGFALMAGAFGVTVFESACDRPRWPWESWRTLKGNRMALAMTLILLFLPIMIVTGTLPALLDIAGVAEEGASLASIIYFVIAESVWAAVSCVWVTFSGLVAREVFAEGGD